MKSLILAILIIAPAVQAQQCDPKEVGGTGVRYAATSVPGHGSIYSWYCGDQPVWLVSDNVVLVDTKRATAKMLLRKMYVESGYRGQPLLRQEAEDQLNATKKP